MALQIIPFEYSINTAYIIKDQGAVLFDASFKGVAQSFSKLLSDSGIEPEEIKLIIISHGDFDHTGGAKELQELTGAKIVMHKMDRGNLENSIFHWPEGVNAWGKFSRALFKPMLKKKVAFPPAKVDIALDDHGLSLKEYGIPGEIVFTPGHTYGSISVLLDSGEAFVGCMAHNRAPFVFKPRLPIYAKDIELIKKSWKTLIDKGAKTIYPGHGKPFPLEKIRKYLN
jgi:glyoxylase-like metal-dependent hydrolase (beta-lactamase superfamily II)